MLVEPKSKQTILYYYWMVRNWIKMMNKVIFLIKQLIYDFIIATSFYIVNFWNSLRIKISCRPKSLFLIGSWLFSYKEPKNSPLVHYPLSITTIVESHPCHQIIEPNFNRNEAVKKMKIEVLNWKLVNKWIRIFFQIGE